MVGQITLPPSRGLEESRTSARRDIVVPLALVTSLVSGIKEAEPHLVKQLLHSGIVKGPWFYLKAASACHPPPNSAALAGEMESWSGLT